MCDVELVFEADVAHYSVQMFHAEDVAILLLHVDHELAVEVHEVDGGGEAQAVLGH